jgi:hypothetical protein
MVCASDVVTRNHGDESSCAIRACWLHSTKRVGLDSGGTAITVTFGLYTSIDTSGVAAP